MARTPSPIATLCSLLLLASPQAHVLAQTAAVNQVLSVGYTPALPAVAPGQMITLFLNNLSVSDAVASQYPYPTTLSGISVGTSVLGAPDASGYPTQLGILRVVTEPCGNLQLHAIPGYCPTTEVTVEIPDVQVCLLLSAGGGCVAPGAPPYLVLSVSIGGVTFPPVALRGYASSPHLLNSCDRIFGVPSPASTCTDLITHGDGSFVNTANPAKVGEEIVVYFVGEGYGFPAQPLSLTYSVGGVVVPGSYYTQTVTPVYTGGVSGIRELYQINFVVPPMPLGTLVCQQGSSFQIAANASITTVAAGGASLGFCVVP